MASRNYSERTPNRNFAQLGASQPEGSVNVDLQHLGLRILEFSDPGLRVGKYSFYCHLQHLGGFRCLP